jgi:hypothetical protein
VEIAAPAALILGAIGIGGQTLASMRAGRFAAGAAEAEAVSIREAAAAEEAQSRRESARVMAKGRAIGAAAGLDIASGSPLLLELENAKQAELEALTIRRRGQQAAFAKTLEARLARRGAEAAFFTGLTQGASLLATWRGGSSSGGAPAPRFGTAGHAFHVRGPGGGMGPV